MSKKRATKSNIYCCVPQCSTYYDGIVSFHSFPRYSQNVKAEWVRVLKIGIEVSRFMRVCSKHFKKEDFIFRAHAKLHTLKKNVIPSQNLPKVTHERSNNEALVSQGGEKVFKRCRKLINLPVVREEEENMQMINNWTNAAALCYAQSSKKNFEDKGVQVNTYKELKTYSKRSKVFILVRNPLPSEYNLKMSTTVQKYYTVFDCAKITPNDYQCDICNFKCALKVELYYHSVQIHSLAEIRNDITDIIKKWNCKNCNFQTYSFLVFYKHHCKMETKEKNSNIDPFTCASLLELYKCTKCDFSTNLKILLKSHVNQACDSSSALNFQNNFTCANCALQTSSILVLYKHVCKNETNENPTWFQCEHCKFGSKWKPSFLRHMKFIHPTGKQYDCKHCEFTSTRRIDLKKHTSKEHSPEKWFHCEQCNYRAKRKSSLLKHIKNVHAVEMCFKCEHCQSGFAQKLQLKRHIEQQHTMSNAKWYQCDYCDYITKNSSQMRNHLSRQHSNNSKTESHHCEHCDFKTKLKSSLLKHLELVHSVKSNFYWFNCVYCEQTFTLRTQLKQHLVDQHSAADEIAKPFHCQYCHYKAHYSYVLKIHMSHNHQNVNKGDNCENTVLNEHNYSIQAYTVHS